MVVPTPLYDFIVLKFSWVFAEARFESVGKRDTLV
jgi:hypothetical protein